MTPVTSTAVLELAVEVWAVAQSAEPPRSWWPWLAGFIPGALVVATLVLLVRWIRRRTEAAAGARDAERP